MTAPVTTSAETRERQRCLKQMQHWVRNRVADDLRSIRAHRRELRRREAEASPRGKAV